MCGFGDRGQIPLQKQQKHLAMRQLVLLLALVIGIQTQHLFADSLLVTNDTTRLALNSFVNTNMPRASNVSMWNLLYRATRDGFTAAAFHSKVLII